MLQVRPPPKKNLKKETLQRAHPPPQHGQIPSPFLLNSSSNLVKSLYHSSLLCFKKPQKLLPPSPSSAPPTPPRIWFNRVTSWTPPTPQVTSLNPQNQPLCCHPSFYQSQERWGCLQASHSQLTLLPAVTVLAPEGLMLVKRADPRYEADKRCLSPSQNKAITINRVHIYPYPLSLAEHTCAVF